MPKPMKRVAKPSPKRAPAKKPALRAVPRPAAKKAAKPAAAKGRAPKGATAKNGPIDWNDAYETGLYREVWEITHPSQELVAAVAALGAIPGSVALDVGCGAGTELLFLTRVGFKGIGVDSAPAALDIVRERAAREGLEVELHEGSVLSLPLGAEAVDLVNDRGCFHHIVPKQRAQYGRELARVMRPGAVLVLRGCRLEDPPFVAITDDVIDAVFEARYFRRGPLLPIELVSDSGRLSANIVVMHRTADPFFR